MVQSDDAELLRTVALRNAEAIGAVRQRAELELLAVREELEDKTSQLARALDEAMKLREFTRELVRAAPPADVARTVCRWARELVEADGAAFIEREGEMVHYVAEDAIAPLWTGQRFPLDACISGWVMLNGQSAAVADVQADPRIPVAAYRPTFVQALLMVPVREVGSADSGGSPAAIGVYWSRHHAASADQTQLLGVMADVAAVALARARLHAAMDEARRQAEALAAIVESSDDAIVGKTLEGVITSWNRAAERMYGWTAAEVVGRSITLIIPEERHAEEAHVLAHLRRGEKIDHFETVRRTRDGRRIDVSLTVSPIRDARGRVIGASKVARDITDRKQAEIALRESQQRFAMLAELVPQLVWTALPDGPIDYFNQRWYDYTGTTPAQALGHGWAEVVHPDDREATRARWEQAIHRGEPVETEYRLRGLDGRYRWFLARGVPMRDAGGRIERWFGTCTNIEGQKQAEQALRDADRAKDEFIATVSHELRQPLTSIVGWVHMLREGGVDGAAGRRGLDIIDRNARVQMRLVDDLLDVSRMVAGKLGVTLEPVDIGAVVRAAVDAARPVARDKGVALNCAVDLDACTVSGDPRRLQQVVGNLVSNALKFTPRDGSVDVRLRRVGGSVEIRVSDTGRGISPEFLPRVFERFTQADRSAARSEGGLGLGLAIVRHLVVLHGGTVEAMSDGEERGATFTVTLPAITRSAGRPAAS